MQIRTYASAALLPFLLAACGVSSPGEGTTRQLAVRPNAQEITRDMVRAMEDVRSGAMNGTLDVRVDDAESKESVKVLVRIASRHDARDEENAASETNLRADLDGTVGGDAMKGSADVDVTVVGSDAYLRLNSLSLSSGELAQFQSILDQIKGQWYVFRGAIDQARSAAREQGGGSFADGLAGEDATPVQRAEMRALVERTNFFDATADDRSVEIGGVETYKITARLNKPEIVAFAREASRINGEVMSAEDVRELERMLGEVDFQGTLYIGVEDKRLHRLAGTVTPAKGSELSSQGSFVVTMDFTFSAYNEDQNVTAPSGAQEFDLNALLGV